MESKKGHDIERGKSRDMLSFRVGLVSTMIGSINVLFRVNRVRKT